MQKPVLRQLKLISNCRVHHDAACHGDVRHELRHLLRGGHHPADLQGDGLDGLGPWTETNSGSVLQKASCEGLRMFLHLARGRGAAG